MKRVTRRRVIGIDRASTQLRGSHIRDTVAIHLERVPLAAHSNLVGQIAGFYRLDLPFMFTRREASRRDNVQTVREIVHGDQSAVLGDLQLVAGDAVQVRIETHTASLLLVAVLFFLAFLLGFLHRSCVSKVQVVLFHLVIVVSFPCCFFFCLLLHIFFSFHGLPFLGFKRRAYVLFRAFLSRHTRHFLFVFIFISFPFAFFFLSVVLCALLIRLSVIPAFIRMLDTVCIRRTSFSRRSTARLRHTFRHSFGRRFRFEIR
mmetsp:Transcript_38943/g.62177  ORF Transcript_38943/g.62177 Transcript_38943/m.62177 type:complete len:260 (+) Transcript_38943:646-1425(+)